MAFCDYCDCPNCQDGGPYLSHGRGEDGRWICDVCWHYDECVRAKREAGDGGGPCEDESGAAIQCEHRPVIVSEWLEWTEA